MQSKILLRIILVLLLIPAAQVEAAWNSEITYPTYSEFLPTNECISACAKKIGGSAGAGFLLGIPVTFTNPVAGIAVGASFAIVGGLGGGLQCGFSAVCAKTRKQELLEKETLRLKNETLRLKAENDLREERLRFRELERESRKQNEEKKSQK